MFNFKEYLPFYRRNINLAVPVMITQAGQMVVQMADNIMVGHLGTTQFAGVSFANTIFVIGMAFCICFTQGLTPYAGQNFGSGNYKEVTKYFQNALVLNLILSICVMTIMALIMPFMEYMGQDPDILEYARSYFKIMVVSVLPFMIFFTIRNFSEGIGITKYAMYITIGSNIINIILNWLLIFGKCGMPQMGVSGAALATLISRIVMLAAFIVAIFTIKEYKRFTSLLEKNFIDKKKIKELLGTSTPIAIQGLIEVTAFSLSGIMVGWFGKIALAGHQIAMTMSTFSFMMAQGIGAATTIRVSHQLGEKDFTATRKAGFAAMHLSILFMGSAGLIFILFRNVIPYMFTTDPQVIEIAASLLIVCAVYQIFDALQLTGLAALRAMMDVKIPLLFSTLSYYFICLPSGYLFGHTLNIGPLGVWLGLLFGLICASILFLIRFDKTTKKLITNNR
ncbi:MAG: MATE family efflux transporter [Bacteroidales bacterium]|nr:MATE family efflux transporter [Bacteroidales bacterium]